MNIQTLSPHPSQKSRKRVGRGGKRGTYSGKGMKGQKSRSGAKIAPLFTGGAPSLMGQGSRVIHKKRGQKNVVNTKFKAKYSLVSLAELNSNFQDKEVVNLDSLLAKRLISARANKVKILASAQSEAIDKKFIFQGVIISKTIRDNYSV